MYQKQKVLIYCLSILSCINFIKPNNTKITKFNVLFVIIDDLRHLSFEDVNLPNIHKLAAKGVSFQNAFAQQALCAPSRNSILTGRRPDSLRLYDFYSYWRDNVANFTTMPQFFKENGYNTFSVGKVFHPGQSSNFTDDYPYSWSEYPYRPPSEKYENEAFCEDAITRRLQKNLICPVEVKKQPGGTLPDLEIVKHAVKILIKKNEEKPFFLAVGFHKPHIPLRFPQEYLKRIPINKVRPPKYPYKPKDMPIAAWHPWTDVRRRDDIQRLKIAFPMGIMPHNWTLRVRQSYYAAATYIDDLIGLLMSYVDTRKTIVVLTSDHGWSLGENGLWAKYSNFDVALKVPLIFNAPMLPHRTIHTPVELIDIFPTLVDLTGLRNNIPQCLNKGDKSLLCFEGKNLSLFMKNDGKNSEINIALSQYPRPSVNPQNNSDKPRLKNIRIMGYSIRTKRYRYTEWISFNNSVFTNNWNKMYGMELYDHIIDPNEWNNLCLVSKYKNIKKYLSTLLRSHVDPNYSNTYM